MTIRENTSLIWFTADLEAKTKLRKNKEGKGFESKMEWNQIRSRLNWIMFERDKYRESKNVWKKSKLDWGFESQKEEG